MQNNARPVQLLCIGCGAITDAHFRDLENHKDQVRVAAICDPSESARSVMLQKLPDGRSVQSFSDYREAISRLEGAIDGAIITTPHFLHFPQAKACVEAGIPVLVEKPICNNVQEAKDLLALSNQHNVLVVAGQNRRYEYQARWLKNWIQSNSDLFGEIRSFDLRGWQNVAAWIADKPDKTGDFWIFDKKRAGGGVVVSLLVHYIDMVRYLTGIDFAEVSAKGRFDPPFKNGAESSCCALLTLSNGAVGTMHANYLTPQTLKTHEVFNLIGEHGYIGNEQGWKYGSTEGQQPDGWHFQYKNIKDVPEAPSDCHSSFTLQLHAFANAVRTNTKPISHIEENFNTMATIEAIYQSLENDGAATQVMPTPILSTH
ncbi:MAG: Gfo/Idh/MocA family oxidoreductase [Verrucomicrobiota bacterium]